MPGGLGIRVKQKVKSRKAQIMLYAEWSGKSVVIRNHNKQHVRRINVRCPVVGVQISGDSETEAMVAIAMNNGRTCLYKSSGVCVRQG